MHAVQLACGPLQHARQARCKAVQVGEAEASHAVQCALCGLPQHAQAMVMMQVLIPGLQVC